MNKAFEVIKNRFFANTNGMDRLELKKKARPHQHLHRGQLKAMLKWDQHPVIAYK